MQNPPKAVKIFKNNGFWWIVDNTNSQIYLTPEGIWKEWTYIDSDLLGKLLNATSIKYFKYKPFFNSKRYAISILKRFYPKIKIIIK